MASSSVARFFAPGFLPWATSNRKALHFGKNGSIYAEGERSDAIYYIERGSVKLTVTSNQGREAIIALCDGGEFFGESCISSEPQVRSHNAIALSEVCALRIERADIIGLLRHQDQISFLFITYLLRRNAVTETRLADSLLYSGEKHLARALLSLAHEGSRIPKVSQQTLAEITGITRQRVNYLMQHFKKLGYIEYSRGWRVRNSLNRVARND